MAADRQWTHSSVPKTNNWVQCALASWAEGSRTGRATFQWLRCCWLGEKVSLLPGVAMSHITETKIKQLNNQPWGRHTPPAWQHVSRIVPLTPGLKESVVTWSHFSRNTKFFTRCSFLVIRDTVQVNAINTPTLRNLWAAEADSNVTRLGPQGVLVQQKVRTDLSSAFLRCGPRNRQGQALCQLRIRSSMIVIFHPPLKSAVMESAVIVDCRSYNEASAFFAVDNRPPGSLCCIFTSSVIYISLTLQQQWW